MFKIIVGNLPSSTPSQFIKKNKLLMDTVFYIPTISQQQCKELR